MQAESAPLIPPDNWTSLPALRQVQTRVYTYLSPTPQAIEPQLSTTLNTAVWIKYENQTPLGAFKMRGGRIYLQALQQRHPAVQTVVTATRGNHGQSIGFAGQALGITPIIFVPANNCSLKNQAMRDLGVDLRIVAGDFQTAVQTAKAFASGQQLHFVPSFHPYLVQGVASYSLELLEAAPQLSTVYVPIGQGSGICGMITARNALGLRDRLKIVGVVAEAAPAYAWSMLTQTAEASETAESIADGVACREANPDALAMMLGEVDHIVQVPEYQIYQAMTWFSQTLGQPAEGAGAIALAALWQEAHLYGSQESVGIIFSGGNVMPEIIDKAKTWQRLSN